MAFTYSTQHDGPEAGKVEVTGREVRSTVKAVLWEDGTRGQQWLPKRKIEIVDGGGAVLMPRWLAEKVGYV